MTELGIGTILFLAIPFALFGYQLFHVLTVLGAGALAGFFIAGLTYGLTGSDMPDGAVTLSQSKSLPNSSFPAQRPLISARRPSFL